MIRVFEDRQFTQPRPPLLWHDKDVEVQKTPAGWAILDNGKTVVVSGTVSDALGIFNSLTEDKEDDFEN